MNVDVGGLGLMSVTVPKNCQKGDTFLFTLPMPQRDTEGDAERDGGAASSAPAPVPSEAGEDGRERRTETQPQREWIAATRLEVGDVVDVMPEIGRAHV